MGMEMQSGIVIGAHLTKYPQDSIRPMQRNLETRTKIYLITMQKQWTYTIIQLDII